MRVGVIGAGLQGGRRGPVVRDFPGMELVAIASEHGKTAKVLADRLGCQSTVGWESIVEREDIDTVLVLTPPHLHAVISIAAMKAGKHVLCEKPLANSIADGVEMVAVSRATGVKLKCGFNHRHHPGIQKAKKWFDDGLIGEVNFIRCRYGICGRPNYEKEWRADPKITGGGHLMEQGIHGIDLARWFAGDFTEASCFTATSFWKIKPLEDNAFALYQTAGGVITSIHSSLTQWKNLFSFEIYGHNGYISVEGLGGSYGTERAILGKRDFTAPFGEETVEFRGSDRSWYEEWKEFVSAIEEGREPLGSAGDGLEALRLVLAAYESAGKGCSVSLEETRRK